MTSRRVLSLLGAALAALLGTTLLTGCGGTSSPDKPAASPHQALAAAKARFDRATSVHLTLSTKSTPKGGNGVLSADGVLTHAPAFKGEVEVYLNGIQAKVPVVSVGGKLYAKLPLTTHYAVIDPTEYGAPDPATFMDPHTGVSTLLTELQHVKAAGQERSGRDILTTYTGTLPGSRVKPIIPSADPSSSYATRVGIDQQGRIATVQVTGRFFAGRGAVTYDLTLDGYGAHVTIAAP
ncbi:LppX_LprAFG lipoprotein [Nocardioides terrisoli]|uniref:LppX_LprAFG lipoprotein n=1 Tax=Nocardioides terrisoli TaxID=3388267 RepID=UPI00287BA25A|nr:LppX_LprAFG lipoprotein [Nocardioides marmorisolisilvae]